MQKQQQQQKKTIGTIFHINNNNKKKNNWYIFQIKAKDLIHRNNWDEKVYWEVKSKQS